LPARSPRVFLVDYRSLSMWFDTLDEPLEPRPSLTGRAEVDVAIVGGGYTGLWAAYYLKKAEPDLKVAVLEREICGFGASGRNGGWCSALFATSRDALAAKHGRGAAIAMQKAMFATVDEVGRVTNEEGIDAHFVKGGSLTLASKPAHVASLKKELEEERSWGFDDIDYRWLDPDEAAKRLNTQGLLGAIYTPHCAAVNPARLARGLARVVEELGVQVYEKSPVTGLGRGSVSTSDGKVKADLIVRGTEAYTARFRGMRRELLPVYSLMIATEPLPQEVWDEIGWAKHETFTDGRHLLIYAQRTKDDRIAFGGRGAPYHYGSRIKPNYEREPAVFDDLWNSLTGLLPAVAPFKVTHRWGGPLGIPRDWATSVGVDRDRGLAWAGGYVGDGVSTTNLAGRTLRDLILERETELTDLPWVDHRSPRWEPEPLRWLGVNLMRRVMSSADKVESRTGKPSARAEWANKLINH
jgi:glycine/D-amino acid oxidase-like deaminating enzyme